MSTVYISTIEAKEQFAELINRVNHNKDRIILTRREKEVAALISLEDLQTLLQIVDKKDVEDAAESLSEARTKGSLTIDDFKKEQG